MPIAPYVSRAALRLAACLLLAFTITGTVPPASADTKPVDSDLTSAPAFSIGWLEPRGLNVVDLVGDVPETFLAGSVLSYTPGYGILRYESGRRNGDIVTVTAKAYPRFVVAGGWNGSMFSCLGQGARMDQLGSVSPPSLLRVYFQGRDVTREVDLYSHVPSGKAQPVLNPRESESRNLYRYAETNNLATSFTADNQLILPSNMGCELIMSLRDYRELTLVFTVNAPKLVSVSVVGSEAFTFHSYLGPGYAGWLNSLTGQLYANGYQNRAEKFDMHVPAQAEYFYLNFPPSPADPYTAFPGNPLGNTDRPVGGSYRVGIPMGLTVDHVNSMGLPLRGHWQDIDQADGAWLNYTNEGPQLAAPEYFLPAGVAYQPCMNQGGCSAGLLATVWNTAMSMSIAYLRVERISTSLERVPVQMVGSGYHGAGLASDEAPSPGAVVADAQQPEATAADATVLAAAPRRAFLPMIKFERPAVPPDDPSGCSTLGGCGWFAADGRMVDYIPRP